MEKLTGEPAERLQKLTADYMMGLYEVLGREGASSFICCGFLDYLEDFIEDYDPDKLLYEYFHKIYGPGQTVAV